MVSTLLARAGGVELYAIKDFFISFFSSPYAPHLLGKSVDLSFSTEFDADFYSPIKGNVVKVIEIYSGLGPYSETDYVIFVRSGENYVKFMHIMPEVRVGDLISEGDVVGRYIRSNYFSYHHLPHAHVEVTKHLTLRPVKSFNIYPSEDLVRIFNPLGKFNGNSVGIELEVLRVCKDFTLCRSLGHPVAVAGDVPAMLQGELGVGIGYLGLIHLHREPLRGSDVFFLGKKVGYVVRVGQWYSLMGRERVKSFREWFLGITSISNISRDGGWYGIGVYVNGKKVDGVEFLISNVCNVKIVGDAGLRVGDR
ncbi:MAG: hypothetical protein QW596_04465, partial [Sulfolobales archaeon]